jgi:hypothetical protein
MDILQFEPPNLEFFQQSGCGNLGLLGSASSLFGLWNIIGAGLLTGSEKEG